MAEVKGTELGGVPNDPRAEMVKREEAFRSELEQLINRHSRENGSDTPDFILADYLVGCLRAFDAAVDARARWYRHGRYSDQQPAPEQPQ